MDIEQLRCFLAIVDEGTFARAADSLHRSTSAVSRAIKELERSIGADLFVRSHRQVELTAAGLALAEPARQTVVSFDALPSTMRERLAGQQHRLRVGVAGSTPTVPLETLRAAVGCAVGPEVEATFTVGTSARLMAEVSRGVLDLALTHLPVLAPDLTGVPLLHYEWQVAMPADHPLASRARLTMADLCGEPVVVQPRSMHPVAVERITHRLTLVGARPEPDPDGEGVKTAHLVLLSRRLALVTTSRIGGLGRLFDTPDYALVPLDDEVPEWTLGLVRRTLSDLDQLHPGLWDAVVAAFAALTARLGLPPVPAGPPQV